MTFWRETRGSPSRSCSFVNPLTFCYAHALINSEKIFVLNLLHVICGNLKYVSEHSLWLLNVCYPLQRVALVACLSLEGMLPGVSVGAVSQEVPLVRLHCKGTVSMELRASPVPPSRFSILILVTMATLNSQCLVNCLSDAWWRIKCSQLVGSESPTYNYLRALTLLCQWSLVSLFN